MVCPVGIEIVVDMQSVNVIASEYVAYDIAYILAVFFHSRVHDKLSVVREDTLGMAYGDMV